jgi:hypothetical protein
MESGRWAVEPRESVAATVNENVPRLVVVPEIEPLLAILLGGVALFFWWRPSSWSGSGS